MTDAAFAAAARAITVASDGLTAVGAPGARDRLRDAVRGEFDREWRVAAAYAASGLRPSRYPEETGAVAVVMAAADAYAGGEGTGAQDGARLLTVGEVAAAARVAPSTVYRAIGSGELNAARIGRAYRVRELDARRWLGGG